MRAWPGALIVMMALTSPVMAGSEEDALHVVEQWAAAVQFPSVGDAGPSQLKVPYPFVPQ